MKYLEKIYSKVKQDGHFSKFQSFDEFENYFSDNESYGRLWTFLKSKDYKIAVFEEFLSKILREDTKQHEPAISELDKLYSSSVNELQDSMNIITTNLEKTADAFSLIENKHYNQPISAIAEVDINQSNVLQLPELLRIGTLKVDKSETVFPLLIPFSNSKGIVFLASNELEKTDANCCIQNIAFRLLGSVPLNQVRIYIIDNCNPPLIRTDVYWTN